MKVEPKKVAIGLVAAFLLLIVWNDPQQAGESMGDFIGKTTSWLGDAFDKATEFAEAIVE